MTRSQSDTLNDYLPQCCQCSASAPSSKPPFGVMTRISICATRHTIHCSSKLETQRCSWQCYYALCNTKYATSIQRNKSSPCKLLPRNRSYRHNTFDVSVHLYLQLTKPHLSVVLGLAPDIKLSKAHHLTKSSTGDGILVHRKCKERGAALEQLCWDYCQPAGTASTVRACQEQLENQGLSGTAWKSGLALRVRLVYTTPVGGNVTTSVPCLYTTAL